MSEIKAAPFDDLTPDVMIQISQLDRIEEKLDRVIGLVDKVGDLIDTYEPEITPLIAKAEAMLEKAKSHPMMRWLL